MPMTSPPDDSPAAEGPLDRLLGLFSDVRPGEGARATAMLVNIFLILLCYYVIKTVREPLILGEAVPGWLQRLGVKGPAELSAYGAAGQALVMMAFVPAYSWFASRANRMRLVTGVTVFFAANIVMFALALQAGVPQLGVAFYIWVGLFNMSIVAQFWSYANDIYTKDEGDRLFPIIAVGMTAGAPLGAWMANRMFKADLPMYAMLYIGAALLLATALFYAFTSRGRSRGAQAKVARARIGGKAAFSLVFTSRYVGLIAVLAVLLNYVNQTGEYLLRSLVTQYAAAALLVDPGFDDKAFIGQYMSGYFFWVNVAAVLLQVFLARRLVKHFGVAGVLFALPLIALGAYALITVGATLALVRWAKTAENATDYSIMNTAKGLIWLPTSREEKYKAKQAVDTFFVRLGDVAAAVAVFVGTTWLPLGIRGFAALNVAVVIAWLAVAALVVRGNRRLSAAGPAKMVDA
jgi:AAA family ATP:ADP antiporter